MNTQIGRLFSVFVLLFAVLIGFTTYWTTVKADDLESQAIEGQRVNQRPLLEQQQIPRGVITAKDGTKLATNKRSGSGETRVYTRRYPQGELFGNPLGYSFIQAGDAGIERYYDDELAGRENEFASLLDQLLGERKEGDDLRTNLDPAGQRAAFNGLRGRAGAVVALEPSTGKVLVMASQPTYNPNGVPEAAQKGTDPGRERLNRTTAERYPPGSTFKVVTAAAAIDTGKYEPSSTIDGKNGQVIGGRPLNNFGMQDFGATSLTDALTFSVNTVFGKVGEDLGDGTMYRYMRRFGFFAEPPLDLPRDEIIPSGVFRDGKLADADEGVDIGRVSIGQSGDAEGAILATPLQMATVAATIANDGVRMEPRIADKFVAPDGRVTEEIRDERAAKVIEPETADALNKMMRAVVEEGSGTAAALSGVQIAGKTGTAEKPGTANNQAWFIAFAPANDPKIAIAVTIENTPGTGGEEAAPIAKQVLQVMLGEKADG